MILPLKQNQLDGLCGLMSTINAIRYLFPDILGDEEDLELQHLVSQLIDYINTRSINFSEIWKNGCEREDVLVFLDFWLLKGFEIQVFNLGEEISKTNEKEFWAEASKWLDKESIIIAGFCNPDPHWTCIKKISKNTLYHFDSSIYNETKIKNTDTTNDGDNDWFFNRKDIFLIRRI